MGWWAHAFIGTAVLLAACSSPPVLERLDERAGLVSRHSAAPLVFARTDPRYARSARDYLYVAPLEINRQGVREYFLWVGVGTTLDRGFLAPVIEQPHTLYVTIEGEPMELPLRPLDELVRRTGEEPEYSTAVALQAELAARVTLQQLRLLADAELDSIVVARSAQPPGTYVRWERGAGFGDFLLDVER